MLTSRLTAELAALVLIAVILGGTWAHGYGKGKASVQADLDALQRSYTVAAAEARGKAETAQRALEARNRSITEDYLRDTKLLAARAAATERRIADLLRQRAGGDAVPATAGGAAGATGAARRDELERIRGAASGLVVIGEGCERDAARLRALQSWAKGIGEVY